MRITTKKVNPQPSKANQPYRKFDKIDGQHPWQKDMPEGCINYQVRVLNSGKVAYFNYNLAKEMGLIPKDHPHKMNSQLENKLLETFNLRIINEYDIERKRRFPKSSIKEHPYMATRYLQLQHKNKQGATSGDGRGIWNGVIKHRGHTWDVSSRGTGVTTLAPGAVTAGRPLESGNTDHGYGCGLAEIDELYSSALMSEVLHHNGYNTERMLVIVEQPGGYGVGVRAGKNLFRPAHMFLYLKQEDYGPLKKATDFILSRQIDNKDWDIPKGSKLKYIKMLDAIAHDFAKFTAYLERDYIFAWLDWDGDNVLASAGIIDYGSIRQFGIRHDQYRYDDVERFSTNLNEQRTKARQIIQTFCQLADFLDTKNKKPIGDFKNHPILNKFDKAYDYYLLEHFLFQIGLHQEDREKLLLKKRSFVERLYSSFLKLEKVKTKKKLMNVEDGVNRPALFNMRKLLAHLSTHLNKNTCLKDSLESHALFQIMLASDHHFVDAKPSPATLQNIDEFIKNLDTLIEVITNKTKFKMKSTLTRMAKNLQMINSQNRVTGNALVFIVDEILKKKQSGVGHSEIQILMDTFISQQCINPEATNHKVNRQLKSNKSKALMRTVFSILEEHSEDI